MVWTCTGAVPLRVTRLLLVVMTLVPAMVKAALPPALLMVLRTKVDARADGR